MAEADEDGTDEGVTDDELTDAASDEGVPDESSTDDDTTSVASRGRRPLLVLSVALALFVAALVGYGVVAPDDEAAPAAAADHQGHQGTVPPSTSAPLDDPLDAYHDLPSTGSMDVEEYGWGAHQPVNMVRPVVLGTDSKPLSPERRQLLGEMLVQARDATLALPTLADAEAAGYSIIHMPKPGRGIEAVNYSLIDDTFDIDKPEMLVYLADEPDAPVVGMAYYVTGPVDSLPPDDFPLEAIGWHHHRNICMVEDEAVASEDFPCEGGTIRDWDGWMVDLWVVPGWENPWGLISSKHPDLVPPQD